MTPRTHKPFTTTDQLTFRLHKAPHSKTKANRRLQQTKEEIQVANKHSKRSSASVSNQELQLTPQEDSTNRLKMLEAQKK